MAVTSVNIVGYFDASVLNASAQAEAFQTAVTSVIGSMSGLKLDSKSLGSPKFNKKTNVVIDQIKTTIATHFADGEGAERGEGYWRLPETIGYRVRSIINNPTTTPVSSLKTGGFYFVSYNATGAFSTLAGKVVYKSTPSSTTLTLSSPLNYISIKSKGGFADEDGGDGDHRKVFFIGTSSLMQVAHSEKEFKECLSTIFLSTLKSNLFPILLQKYYTQSFGTSAFYDLSGSWEKKKVTGHTCHNTCTVAVGTPSLLLNKSLSDPDFYDVYLQGGSLAPAQTVFTTFDVFATDNLVDPVQSLMGLQFVSGSQSLVSSWILNRHLKWHTSFLNKPVLNQESSNIDFLITNLVQTGITTKYLASSKLVLSFNNLVSSVNGAQDDVATLFEVGSTVMIQGYYQGTVQSCTSDTLILVDLIPSPIDYGQPVGDVWVNGAMIDSTIIDVDSNFTYRTAMLTANGTYSSAGLSSVGMAGVSVSLSIGTSLITKAPVMVAGIGLSSGDTLLVNATIPSGHIYGTLVLTNLKDATENVIPPVTILFENVPSSGAGTFDMTMIVDSTGTDDHGSITSNTVLIDNTTGNVVNENSSTTFVDVRNGETGGSANGLLGINIDATLNTKESPVSIIKITETEVTSNVVDKTYNLFFTPDPSLTSNTENRGIIDLNATTLTLVNQTSSAILPGTKVALLYLPNESL